MSEPLPLPPPRTVSALAAHIDHTLLKPAATLEDILKTAREGVLYGVAAVCVNPIWVREVAVALEGSDVACCAVAGFPLGTHDPEVVALEAERAVENGANEIDMVMNIGRAVMDDWDEVARGVDIVRRAVPNAVLKVILEICELTPEMIAKASNVTVEAGADFVKTSTGFGRHGATVEAVRIMAETVRGRAEVKAAGGIHSLAGMLEMIKAGATRIGASSTVTILKEVKR